MPSFNDLPYELHEKIIVDALYCTHTTHEIDGALENESWLSAGLARANIKLGQRTLRALKLTSRRMYIDAAIGSRIWLDCETIDLLEELEAIKARLFKYEIVCRSSTKFYADTFVGRLRAFWISKVEIRTVYLYKRRLEEAELRTWKRLRHTLTGTESIEGFCDFMNMVERQNASQGHCGNPSPHSQRRSGLSRREKLLTICLHGVDVGPDGTYKPGTYRPDPVLGRWERQRTLPIFHYRSSIMQWYRPFQKQKLFQTIREGFILWERRIIGAYGIASKEYKRFVHLRHFSRLGQLIRLGPDEKVQK